MFYLGLGQLRTRYSVLRRELVHYHSHPTRFTSQTADPPMTVVPYHSAFIPTRNDFPILRSSFYPSLTDVGKMREEEYFLCLVKRRIKVLSIVNSSYSLKYRIRQIMEAQNYLVDVLWFMVGREIIRGVQGEMVYIYVANLSGMVDILTHKMMLYVKNEFNQIVHLQGDECKMSISHTMKKIVNKMMRREIKSVWIYSVDS